jgi:hypothetical protein
MKELHINEIYEVNGGILQTSDQIDPMSDLPIMPSPLDPISFGPLAEIAKAIVIAIATDLGTSAIKALPDAVKPGDSGTSGDTTIWDNIGNSGMGA